MGYQFRIKVYGNAVEFTQGTWKSMVFGSEGAGIRLQSYTGPIPNTALRGTLSYAEYLFFWVPVGELDMKSIFKDREIGAGLYKVEDHKSNIFGMAISGPFSRAARALKDAGVSEKYGVKSPMTMFRWTAYDFVKYCDRIVLALQLRHPGN